MPSGKKSWFARHCAPPPPINNTSACPCASCYNVGAGSHHGSSSPYAYSYAPSTSSPMDPRSTNLRSASSSDGASISSASTAATTTTHIEHVKQ
ncbi:hypothetical protein QQX98_005341 [Neonectria punicea]|uniref:Uncharacterized protein n=1 Tax=Neonectria punicea TaxID=979145 RepID=A0ABR1H5E9_9HYPO